jgi:hypothetical protein
MESQIRKQIIKEWTDNLPQDKKIIKLFEKVRDIPYGDIGSRNSYDVYNNNKGTCSGKHELLKELYQELGLKTKDFIAMHKFNDLPVKFPIKIKKILNKAEIIDPHNFFKIYIDNKWVTIDVTWDSPLKKLGFPINENWDGKSDMKVSVIPIKIYEVTDSIEAKKQEIAKLPESLQLIRKDFLKNMTEWLDTIR